MKAYGNMSNVEKSLNRAELNAYKQFDVNNHFSLVPGISHKKNTLGTNSP
jgi:hypothetical protein